MDDVIALLTRAVREERVPLAALARREGLSDEEALDCVQEAFCTFLQKAIAGDLPTEEGRPAFLAGIVRNHARNRRRTHAHAKPHQPLGEHLTTETLAADESLARAEEHVRLHACVARLCDTQRAVVTMRMLEERDGEDVAAALGVSRGYVDVLVHRAKSALLSCLRE